MEFQTLLYIMINTEYYSKISMCNLLLYIFLELPVFFF